MAVFVLPLLTVAVVLGAVAGPLLDRGSWTVRHPGTALVCWLGSLAGVMAAFAGLFTMALMWPPAPLHRLLEWLHACVLHHAHAGLIWGSIVSGALVAAFSHRLLRGVPRLWRAVFHRRRHREMLNLIAHEDRHHPDVLILDHPVPVAYCLPSRRRSIVVSSGAQKILDADQLTAVLAHERAHLRQRHHLLLLVLDLTHSLLPWLPTIRRAQASVPQLLEMIADDAAVRRCGRSTLSEALRRLVALPASSGTLAASGTGEQLLTRRLTRLEPAPAKPLRGIRALGWSIAISAAAGPMLLVIMAVTAIPLPC